MDMKERTGAKGSMKQQRSSTPGRIGRAALACLLAASLALTGAGTALAAPSVPYWSTPTSAKAVDPDFLTTFGVRDGSAGPDFLGISNTNFDFTAGPADSPQQYTGTTAGQLATYVGAGLAIWATSVNEETNAYYQNLYYNIALAPVPTPLHATTWMSNPFASWGDSNGTASTKGNAAGGAPTVAGLEYDPDILFGANHYTNWQDELPDGSNSQTETYSYLSGGAEPGYEPAFTSNDATNIWAQVYTMGRLAEVAEGVKAVEQDKETRYGNDAVAAAVDYEKAIRGNLLWVASQIDLGNARRKTVAYLYSIDQAGVGYFLTPQASGLLAGDDTGAPPASAACYAANNGTIGYGYRATLPLVTDTFDSGIPFVGGISMQVEDIVRSNPACIVPASSPGALANVDAVVYNATVLTDLSGTTGGRNTSGVGINANYRVPSFVPNWLAAHGLPAASAVIAGDDFGTSSNQGFGLVDTTADGMSPLLYCQRNYTADKSAKAAWAFARVYPALYGGNPDATYCYWVDRVYHVNLADVPTVAQYMLNKTGTVTYGAATAAFLEACFAAGRAWWDATGSADPYWSQFAYYNGSSRASYYSDDPCSEEETDIVGILAPSQFWWVDTGPPASPPKYAYSIGCDFKGVSWWNVWVARREDLGGDLTPSILYAADTYGELGYESYYNLKPTDSYLKGQNPAGADRLGSDVVYLDGHANYMSLVCGDYEYASLFGDEPTGSPYMCGVWCGGDGQSADTLVNYAGLLGRDLSATRLISFVGCNTAGYLEGDDDGDDHFGDNLCEAARDCGAQAVLGFTGSIDGLTPAGLHWKQKYNDGLAFGYTVQGAVDYANTCAKAYADEHGELVPVNLVQYAKVLGDTTVTIAPA
ncbi:MAG: hypothetical protein LBL86_09205 [Coriobacteriales bacterium]|jgi:hypothetical protein|nr:hypothetical protein [Coriobacteriales bacterium]